MRTESNAKDGVSTASLESTTEGKLTDRVALVTGGAQGIGRAIAERLQAQGAHVFVLDCDERAGQRALRAMSSGAERPVHFLRADLASRDGFPEVTDSIARACGRLDMLFNNAGVEIEKGVEELTVEEWDHVLNVNLRGALLLTQAVLPLFPETGGAIVNISSIHATHAFPGSIAYACSKAGMLALTRNLALELASRRIRVNAICPGYIDTRLWDEYLRSSADPARLAAETTALHPLGRRGQPADVAQAAIYLASDAASFVTGTELVVDGGLTMRAHC